MTTKTAAPKNPADAPPEAASDEATTAEPRPLCADNHRAMKASEADWQAATFAGYQPLGRKLGELRTCPHCQSTVLRPQRFTVALRELFDRLLGPAPRTAVHILSARMLAAWAMQNLPTELGTIAEHAARPEEELLLDVDEPQDWLKLGRDLRARRERAGLSRGTLGRISGIADSTIRNLETGRHRPSSSTMQRLSSVPALRLMLGPRQR